mgnify:CR=1 FL=1
MPDSNFTKTFTTDNFSQFVTNSNTIGKEVGGLARLTTTVDSDLVGAINELDSDIGARPHTTLNTNSKTITGAVNEIHTAGNASLVGLTPDSANKLGGFNDSAERTTVGGALNSLSADVRILDSDIGSARAKTTLSTTSKNIVGGINELDAELGDSALDSGLTGMTIRRAINALDSNHDSATTQLRTDIANSFRYTTISADTGSDTVDSASGSLAIVGDGIIQTTMSGNRLLVDHTVVGATDVDNSGKTYIQDITMDSAGHVTAIGSTAISGLDNNDVAAGAAINAEKIHDGTISNTEFGHLNGVSSNIQTQLDNKVINNPTVTLSAGTGLSGGGSFTGNQSGNSTITFNATAVSNSNVTISAGTNLSGGGSFTLNGGGGTITLNATDQGGLTSTEVETKVRQDLNIGGAIGYNSPIVGWAYTSNWGASWSLHGIIYSVSSTYFSGSGNSTVRGNFYFSHYSNQSNLGLLTGGGHSLHVNQGFINNGGAFSSSGLGYAYSSTQFLVSYGHHYGNTVSNADPNQHMYVALVAHS